MQAEQSFSFGLPGVSLEPGDHLCAFYKGETERDDVLLPYLAEGVRFGDKIVCVVDACTPDEVLTKLGADGSQSTPGQVDVAESLQIYLRDGQGFDLESMVDFWDVSTRAALEDGYSFVRAVGEMTWALRDAPGVDQLAAYESRLNDFCPRYPQVILCLYDLTRFSGDVVIDMLKTHPKILLNGTVFENPYYVTPDEFLASRN